MRTGQELRNGVYEEFSEILDASNELREDESPSAKKVSPTII